MPARPLPDSLLERADLWRGHQPARIAAEPTGHAGLDALLPGGGWPRGALSELLLARAGLGEWSLLRPALARLSQAGQRVAFVAPPHLPYAPGLAGAGLALAQCWVVEPATDADALWATEQLLRSGAAGAVVAWLDRIDERLQRRLQLAAEQAGNAPLALLVRPERARGEPSVAALRLALRREQGRLEVDLLKTRGGRSGSRVALDAA